MEFDSGLASGVLLVKPARCRAFDGLKKGVFACGAVSKRLANGLFGVLCGVISSFLSSVLYPSFPGSVLPQAFFPPVTDTIG